MINKLKQETREGLLEAMRDVNELKKRKRKEVVEVFIGGALLAVTTITAVTATTIALNKIGEDLGLDDEDENEDDIKVEVEFEYTNEEGVM